MKVGAEYRIAVKLLYAAYKAWCAEQGDKRPGTSSTFGAALREAHASVRASNRGAKRKYVGIKLSEYGNDRYDRVTRNGEALGG